MITSQWSETVSLATGGVAPSTNPTFAPLVLTVLNVNNNSQIARVAHPGGYLYPATVIEVERNTDPSFGAGGVLSEIAYEDVYGRFTEQWDFPQNGLAAGTMHYYRARWKAPDGTTL